MSPIVFDPANREVLRAQVAQRNRGESVPIRWHELLDDLSRRETGIGAGECNWLRALAWQGTLFAWQPSPEAIATAMTTRRLVYLCWGYPARAGWKDRLLTATLRRAKHVLVNDTTTQGEIGKICGRHTNLVPFFIDAEFFAYAPMTGRARFLFCNGTNDRDAAMVLGLAQLGIKVVWLVNDPVTRARYDGLSTNLTIVSGVSYVDLRTFYQTCAVAIMPTLADRHCAGQTTGLEAVACGAPLLVSAGRTAKILSGLPSVTVMERSDCDAWADAAKVISNNDGLGEWTAESRALVQRRLSCDHIRDALAPFFGWPERAPTVVGQ